MNTSSSPITLDETQAILTDARMIPLLRSLRDAVSDYSRDLLPHIAAITDATRAGFIADKFYFNVSNNLAEDKGFDSATVQGQRYVTFDGRLLQRVKHFNGELASRNYPTAQAKAFISQGYLEGFPECDRLHLGYRLDITGLRLAEVFVTRPIGRKAKFNDWVWQVWGDPIRETGTYELQEPLPIREMSRQYAYSDFSTRLG
jgi:hypothetical protein